MNVKREWAYGEPEGSHHWDSFVFNTKKYVYIHIYIYTLYILYIYIYIYVCITVIR